MRRKDHVAMTESMLRNGYDEVHKWIDALAGSFFSNGCPFMHWVRRHNIRALKEKFGHSDSPEYVAGILHIQCDLLSHFGKYVPTPKNERDVKKLLKKEGCWNEGCKWLLEKEDEWLETGWKLAPKIGSYKEESDKLTK